VVKGNKPSNNEAGMKSSRTYKRRGHMDTVCHALMEDTLGYVYLGFCWKYELLGSSKIPVQYPPQSGGYRKSTPILDIDTDSGLYAWRFLSFVYIVQYGLDTTEFTYNPEESRRSAQQNQATSSTEDKPNRCTIM